jgi:UDP-N-acetylglucosamine 2-epimerase (non-hydrolysing)
MTKIMPQYSKTRRIDCIVGARPNFMKIAPILRAFGDTKCCSIRLIHTGQHYDESMSAVFFDELGIPAPDINLEVGSGTNTEQTARVMLGLEPLFVEDRPDMLLVVGNVNSTLAAALVASKLLIPLAHVEAGLRSKDRTMPEEINRLITDQLSDLLLTTERESLSRLVREGIAAERVHFVGNVMIDTLYHNLSKARPADDTIAQLANGTTFASHASRHGFGLVTLHRPSNVDDPAKLAGIVNVLAKISVNLPLLFALHPRTRARLVAAGLDGKLAEPRILLTSPLGYLDMIGLMKAAQVVITDSGGIQEETTALGVPCLTVRDSTERPITVSEGTNTLVGSSPDVLLTVFSKINGSGGKRGCVPELWDGRAAGRIVRHVLDFLDGQLAA